MDPNTQHYEAICPECGRVLSRSMHEVSARAVVDGHNARTAHHAQVQRHP